jgi:hypothetical protein
MGRRANQISIANLGAIHAGDWDHAFIDTGGTGQALKVSKAVSGKVLALFDHDATAEEITQVLMAHLAVSKAAVDDASHRSANSPLTGLRRPSTAKLKAGNYLKGHIKVAGMDITIENPQGSHRRPGWPAMTAHYGYIKRTTGADGDHVDIFVRPSTPTDYNGPVFVVDQQVGDKWDEHKVLLGWSTEKAARQAYLSNYTPGWQGLKSITQLSVAQFKDWLSNGDTTKPLAPQI